MGLGFPLIGRRRGSEAFRCRIRRSRVTVFRTLEDAIGAAWGILHTAPPRPFDPRIANEVDFTTHMHEILEDHLLDSNAVDGFTGEVFSSIQRPEVRNSTARRRARSRTWSLFSRIGLTCNARRTASSLSANLWMARTHSSPTTAIRDRPLHRW